MQKRQPPWDRTEGEAAAVRYVDPKANWAACRKILLARVTVRDDPAALGATQRQNGNEWRCVREIAEPEMHEECGGSVGSRPASVGRGQRSW